VVSSCIFAMSGTSQPYRLRVAKLAGHLASAICAVIHRRAIRDRRFAIRAPAAKRILILAPHMDDEVIGCGGLVALSARAGARVTCVFMTDGATGRTGEDRVRHRALRVRESEAAAVHLGLARLHFLDEPDGELQATSAVVKRLAEVWQEEAPDVVLAPWPWDAHHDHRQTFAAAATTLLRLGRPDGLLCYQVTTPLPIDDLGLVLDTSSVLANKRQALACFQSQSPFLLDLLPHLHSCQRFLLGLHPAAVEVFAPLSQAELPAALSTMHGLPSPRSYLEAGLRAIRRRPAGLGTSLCLFHRGDLFRSMRDGETPPAAACARPRAPDARWAHR
jgi:LmbE family N-acetylglucosaminyl deacetylase